jgi:predicted nucleic acid-binding protein
MKFWDSSAIIPLCLQEPASEQVRGVLKADEDIMVWWSTRIECLSALERRRREGALHADAQLKARAVLTALAAGWSEVLPTELVRQRAERLLSIHPLRAADALQLAAALIWAEEAPQGLEVVCLDQNLREGAFKEGFTVLP